MFTLIVALMLASQAASASTPAPVLSKTSDIEAQNTPRIRTAEQLLKSHEPQAALDALTVALAAYDADLSVEKRRIYCAMSPQESLLYAGMAAKDKVDAVMLRSGYCTALYLKGYALVGLSRIEEAKTIYRRVIALAPFYAQYQTEFGQAGEGLAANVVDLRARR